MLYRTVEVRDEPPPSDDPASFLRPPGPEIRLSPPAPAALADWPLSGHLNQELAALESRIHAVMPIGGGVLLEIALHEERRPKLGDLAGQRLLRVEVAGVGMVAALATKIRLRAPGQPGRAPKGWTAKTVYLWATR